MIFFQHHLCFNPQSEWISFYDLFSISGSMPPCFLVTLQMCAAWITDVVISKWLNHNVSIVKWLHKCSCWENHVVGCNVHRSCLLILVQMFPSINLRMKKKIFQYFSLVQEQHPQIWMFETRKQIWALVQYVPLFHVRCSKIAMFVKQPSWNDGCYGASSSLQIWLVQLIANALIMSWSQLIIS